MAAFLGIDAGTTSMKAAVFATDGTLLSVAREEYGLLTPSPGIVELDAETYWDACCRAVRAAVGRAGVVASEIGALSISSQGETLIPVDAEGVPVRQAIVWLDTRAKEEARRIAVEFEDSEVYQVTGQPEISPGWPASKIMWMRRNEPDLFETVDKFLLLEDYLLYRLTGQFVTEYSLQASSMLLDIRRKGWWAPMMDFVGISAERLPALLEPGQIVGPLSSAGATAFGMTTNTIAVTGAIDQVVGAVGAGNIVPDVVTETTGGALAILVTNDEPLFDPQRRIPVHYHARPDTYCLMAWAQTAGMALRWFRDQFYHLETQVSIDSGLDAYDLMTRGAEQVPPGADGLVVLPHLEGAACPEFNPDARAVFFGATLMHTKAHFVRGILESVAFMLKRNLDIIEQMGIAVREIRSMGGGARSDLWLRIKADVLQKPVRAVEVEETACLGAALMAATAIGHYADLDEAVAETVRLREAVEPLPDHAQVYAERYRQYCELYGRLAPLF